MPSLLFGMLLLVAKSLAAEPATIAANNPGEATNLLAAELGARPLPDLVLPDDRLLVQVAPAPATLSAPWFEADAFHAAFMASLPHHADPAGFYLCDKLLVGCERSLGVTEIFDIMKRERRETRIRWLYHLSFSSEADVLTVRGQLYDVLGSGEALTVVEGEFRYHEHEQRQPPRLLAQGVAPSTTQPVLPSAGDSAALSPRPLFWGTTGIGVAGCAVGLSTWIHFLGDPDVTPAQWTTLRATNAAGWGLGISGLGVATWQLLRANKEANGRSAPRP